MTRLQVLEPEFVEEVPRQLESGKLYISIPYTSAIHLCCCGCGYEVVTTIHPTRWRLIYDGTTVSLEPSVGNWSLPCRSHYVIRRNQVRWAQLFCEEEIEAARLRDQRASIEYFTSGEDSGPDAHQSAHTLAGRFYRAWRRLRGERAS